MRKLKEQSIMHCYPGMVAVVTVQHQDEKNIMSAGWHAYLSAEPPMYGVAVGRDRHTYRLIKESGAFAVHFLPAEKAEIIQKSGVLSGRTMDKIQYIGLEYDQGETIDVPILKDAYVAYECQVTDVRSYGDHDWFAGNITAFYRDDDLFDSQGLPNWEKLSIPLYLGRSQYYMADENGHKKTFIIKDQD